MGARLLAYFSDFGIKVFADQPLPTVGEVVEILLNDSVPVMSPAQFRALLLGAKHEGWEVNSSVVGLVILAQRRNRPGLSQVPRPE